MFLPKQRNQNKNSMSKVKGGAVRLSLHQPVQQTVWDCPATLCRKWIQISTFIQDRDQRRALVKMVINLWAP